MDVFHLDSGAEHRQQAEKIRSLGRYADVLNVYMEEPPLVSDWLNLTKTPNVVVVPFFISDGLQRRCYFWKPRFTCLRQPSTWRSWRQTRGTDRALLGGNSPSDPPSGNVKSLCTGPCPRFLWLPRWSTLTGEFPCATAAPEKKKRPRGGALEVPTQGDKMSR